MTNREFFNAIATAEVAQEIKDFALAEIEKLDNRNAKRRNTMTKEQVVNEGIKQKICEVLADGAKVASEIATALGITTQKVSALAVQLVEAGKLTACLIKAKGKGSVKQYALAEAEVE